MSWGKHPNSPTLAAPPIPVEPRVQDPAGSPYHPSSKAVQHPVSAACDGGSIRNRQQPKSPQRGPFHRAGCEVPAGNAPCTQRPSPAPSSRTKTSFLICQQQLDILAVTERCTAPALCLEGQKYGGILTCAQTESANFAAAFPPPPFFFSSSFSQFNLKEWKGTERATGRQPAPPAPRRRRNRAAPGLGAGSVPPPLRLSAPLHSFQRGVSARDSC